MRLHIHQGPHTTLVAQSDGTRPPDKWLKLPLPRILRKLWYHLPLWDDLSLGIQLSSMFPPTDEVTVYSSRSRLHNLIPPDDYRADSTADGGGRVLGESTDGRVLTVSYDAPLFTVGAASTFLARQVLSNLQAGWAAIVVSPHRSLLDRIARQAAGVPVRWLDPQYGHHSAHLALVSVADCDTSATCSETVIEAAETFLADLGVDLALPAVGTFTGT